MGINKKLGDEAIDAKDLPDDRRRKGTADVEYSPSADAYYDKDADGQWWTWAGSGKAPPARR